MIRRISCSRAALLSFLVLSVGVMLYRGDVVAQAVRDGLLLCGKSLLPSLFPMFVAVTLCVQCGLGQLFPPAWSALFLGLLGGYPIGAKTVAELVKNGDLTASQAQKVLCCCNNCGGAFLLGVVGQGAFGTPRIGVVLWIIHAAVALLFAVFLLPCTAPHLSSPATGCDLVAAVLSGATSMVNLCGFVVFFLAALRLVSFLTGLAHPLFLGVFELTTAVSVLPPTREGFVLAAVLVGWGGISVHAQTASVLAGTGVRMGPYLRCKAAQALLSGGLACLLAGQVM